MELGIPGIEDPVRIGSGGAAVVYVANRAGRRVAVKVFAPDEDARRVERERLAAMAMADHEGVVPVEGSGVTADGRHYLLMPYLPGGSLADRVQGGGPLPAARTAEIGIRLARAVAEAHRRGIRHRDIKPQNILFDAGGRPCLADFGIADLGERAFLTSDGALTGTVPYMAPELVRGEPDGDAADLYSLGATLFFAVEGRPLFVARPGESYEAMVVRRASEPEAVEFSAATPPWLRRVLLRALAPAPAARYPSVAAFAEAIAVAAGSTIPAGLRARRALRRPRWTSPDARPAAAPPGGVTAAPPATWPGIPPGAWLAGQVAQPPTGRTRPAGPAWPTRSPYAAPAGATRPSRLPLALVGAVVAAVIGLGFVGLEDAPTNGSSQQQGPVSDWTKRDPAKAAGDVAAARASFGRPAPYATQVTFHLWGPAPGTTVWLTASEDEPATPFRVGDGVVATGDERSEAPAGRPFPLSTVRFTQLPALVREALTACGLPATRADVLDVRVAVRDRDTAVPVATVTVLDSWTDTRAEVVFEADGRRRDPGQACSFD